MPSRIECLRGQRKQRRLLSVLYNMLSLLPKIKCEVGVKSASGSLQSQLNPNRTLMSPT